jgi:hypothetical protein
MANAIKYNLSAETLALKKGNFWIGTGDVGKGPTSNTGFYNGIEPPTGGFTIYLNKASGGPSIYPVSNEAQLTALTNSISVSTNLIKNNNGGNFANGTVAPFNGSYGTLPTIVDISNDRPYNGSTSTKAAKFVAGGGMNIYTDPSPFTMTVGVMYTFSFWYRQTNSNNFYIAFNNQGGSGDINGDFQAYSSYGYFSNPTQTWQRCSWTFTNVVNKPYFFIYSMNSVDGSECLMTEFTLTEGSMPSGPGLTTSGNCLNWFGSIPTDKMIFNRDYESIVTNGLVLNLDAGFSPSFATIPSNKNGNTLPSWYDLSGNGNNGTLTNGPTYSSNGGGSIVFDGVDDYVVIDVNSFIRNNAAYTFNCFFYYTGGSNGGAPYNIITTPNSDNDGDGFWQHLHLGVQWFWRTEDNISGEYGSTVANPSPFSDNNYYYLTSVVKTDTIIYYINGILQATINTSFQWSRLRNDRTANLFIGSGYGTAYPMSGRISIFSLYNRELSATEILQNYNVQKGRFGL